MAALNRAQIGADFPLDVGCGLKPVEKMAQQDVFGRDGGVGLEFEHPVPVWLLPLQQRRARSGDTVVEPVPFDGHRGMSDSTGRRASAAV